MKEHVSVGAGVTMPPFSDSVLGVDSGFRRALLGRGMVLRVNVVPCCSQNLLDSPAPSGQQAYSAHRPTLISGVNPIFSLSLGYVRGPALSPRVDDALTFTVNRGLYL
jgi:hypothetical protein